MSEVINNDNLLPIGSRKILVTVPETTQPYEIAASYFVQGGTMRIDGEGSFLTSTGESLGKSIVVSTILGSVVYLSSGTYYIIFDSYNVRELRIGTLQPNNENKRLNVNGVNFNDIYEFSEHLYYLSFYGLQNINCNINQFLNKSVYPELNRININSAQNTTQGGCSITVDLDTVENLNAIEFREFNFTGNIDKNLLTGSIENLNFAISSTPVDFYIRDSVLYGELKNVLDSLVAQGKTGTIRFLGNGIVTLNGTALGATTKTFNITPEGWTEQ